MDNFNVGANHLHHVQGDRLFDDELPNEADEIWGHIREWFSPKLEPLAYECLNDFYHGDLLVTPPEQLESFLTLKSLASQGHQNNFTTEYVRGMEAAECTIINATHGLAESVLIPLSEPEYLGSLADFTARR
ncbi:MULTISPECIES: hypothetical protein [Providencia]|uniref:Uncharacterized protein n=1 Tax=Providencia huashanensis TaxID=3037798 RepID=A0AA42FK23_9GAMM|nr:MULTISPECIES: hypothetical protein [Providencia]MBC8654823.1 hypothetical protein [Providencia vermicola]HCI94704.1 hypothetical protein [Providencia sp.]EIL1981586.1 hypothetical protein [Providencia rettgeri]EIU7558387.1 hypothetical protein [Providencia rettgeri]EIU9514195.1 hypothetical protein [Providencia rettgeri]